MSNTYVLSSYPCKTSGDENGENIRINRDQYSGEHICPRLKFTRETFNHERFKNTPKTTGHYGEYPLFKITLVPEDTFWTRSQLKRPCTFRERHSDVINGAFQEFQEDWVLAFGIEEKNRQSVPKAITSSTSHRKQVSQRKPKILAPVNPSVQSTETNSCQQGLASSSSIPSGYSEWVFRNNQTENGSTLQRIYYMRAPSLLCGNTYIRWIICVICEWQILKERNFYYWSVHSLLLPKLLQMWRTGLSLCLELSTV